MVEESTPLAAWHADLYALRIPGALGTLVIMGLIVSDLLFRKGRSGPTSDPDAEWGNYVLLRTWNEEKFQASLRAAEKTWSAERKEVATRIEELARKLERLEA